MGHRSQLMTIILYLAILAGYAGGMAHALNSRPNHDVLARLMPPITAVLTFSDGATEVQQFQARQPS